MDMSLVGPSPQKPESCFVQWKAEGSCQVEKFFKDPNAFTLLQPDNIGENAAVEDELESKVFVRSARPNLVDESGE